MEHLRKVESAVHGLASEWRSAPSISVVGDAAELPFRVPFAILGAHLDGQVFVVAGEQSPEKALSTAVHEVIGHHGFRKMLGAHWSAYMAGVLGAARAGDQGLGLARETVREVYTDGLGECNLHPIAEADEIVARMTEWAFNPAAGRFAIETPLRKQLRAVFNHCARTVLHIDIPMSRDEVDGAIEASRHTLRHGAPLFGFASWLPGWYPSPMKPTGSRTPPRDLLESQQWLEAAEGSEYFLEWCKNLPGRLWTLLSVTGVIVGLLVAVVLLAVFLQVAFAGNLVLGVFFVICVMFLMNQR